LITEVILGQGLKVLSRAHALSAPSAHPIGHVMLKLRGEGFSFGGFENQDPGELQVAID
jgi:hypothetical protein